MGRHIGQESLEPPQPQNYKSESAYGDLEGYWKHPAPEPHCEKYLCFSTPSGNQLLAYAYAMEWAGSL
eukprot:1152698-Pelagomonas_calceolata.AAC.8